MIRWIAYNLVLNADAADIVVAVLTFAGVRFWVAHEELVFVAKQVVFDALPVFFVITALADAYILGFNVVLDSRVACYFSNALLANIYVARCALTLIS